jgi:hypothetical protein
MAADPEGERRKKAEYMARRRQNPKWLVNGRMSCLVRQTLKAHHALHTKRGRSWRELLGYTVEQLMERLQSTIPEGYTWGDYLSGVLELDHIVPVRDFDFKSADDPEFRRCWALENLRLLTKEDNLTRRYRNHV